MEHTAEVTQHDPEVVVLEDQILVIPADLIQAVEDQPPVAEKDAEMPVHALGILGTKNAEATPHPPSITD